jgi:hypothetical protein
VLLLLAPRGVMMQVQEHDRRKGGSSLPTKMTLVETGGEPQSPSRCLLQEHFRRTHHHSTGEIMSWHSFADKYTTKDDNGDKVTTKE